MKKFTKAIMLITIAVVFAAGCGNSSTNSHKSNETTATEDGQQQDLGHEWVDLGLPSGTLWATCNVGADKPEDYGDYFAWGETTTKRTYGWATYKYAKGDYDKLTKYCSDSEYGYKGFTDYLTTLQAGDDPATANWGRGWRTPTKAQWEELLDNTTNEWTTRNGVQGRLFTSMKNANSIFLPAAGCRWGGGLFYTGKFGIYWSSLLNTDYPNLAWYFSFGLGPIYSVYDDSGRHDGNSVRPVRSTP